MLEMQNFFPIDGWSLAKAQLVLWTAKQEIVKWMPPEVDIAIKQKEGEGACGEGRKGNITSSFDDVNGLWPAAASVTKLKL